MTAMQRNGGKLANVLDRAVPGQPVVHIGNHAKINAVDTCLIQHILNTDRARKAR